MQERQVWSLSQDDPLEKEMAPHSSILTWESHGLSSLEGYSSWGHKTVGHDWLTKEQHYNQVEFIPAIQGRLVQYEKSHDYINWYRKIVS